MAHPVRLPGRLLFFILLITGCNLPETPVHAPAFELLNKQDKRLEMMNGLIMKEGKPFNGTLFTLFRGNTDTAELSTYQDGQEDGEWKIFYSANKIKEKRYFEKGRKTGEYLTWWPNGIKQIEYFFKADEYEGTCREWNESGMLTKVMNYRYGYEEGHQQCWYDNGKIKTNYVIKDGRRYGLLGTKNCINVSDSVFKN